MDNLTQNQGTANPAEAEEKQNVAADLGKFKDVKALLSAYASLEAEFTRRSQRLKELEEQSKAAGALTKQPEGAPSAAHDTRSLYELACGDEDVKNAIIADYLKAVSAGKGAPMVAGGIAVPSPKSKPASIREAGRLAAQFFSES